MKSKLGKHQYFCALNYSILLEFLQTNILPKSIKNLTNKKAFKITYLPVDGSQVIVTEWRGCRWHRDELFTGSDRKWNLSRPYIHYCQQLATCGVRLGCTVYTVKQVTIVTNSSVHRMHTKTNVYENIRRNSNTLFLLLLIYLYPHITYNKGTDFSFKKKTTVTYVKDVFCKRKRRISILN